MPRHPPYALNNLQPQTQHNNQAHIQMLASTIQFSNTNQTTTPITTHLPTDNSASGLGQAWSRNQDTHTVCCLRTQQRADTPTNPKPAATRSTPLRREQY